MFVLELNTEYPDDHQELLVACRAEVLAEGYKDFEHGTRATRKKGCDGPMCRKGDRDYGRELQRRLYGHSADRLTAVRRFDSFLDAYAAYSLGVQQQQGVTPRARRTLKTVRTVRRDHLVPASTVQKLHKSRARLAS